MWELEDLIQPSVYSKIHHSLPCIQIAIDSFIGNPAHWEPEILKDPKD